MLKVELVIRIATLLALFGFSYGFCTWLPEKFCETFLGSGSDQSPSRLSTCKWQVFGIRIVAVSLYMPFEFVMLLVVWRNIRDRMFNIRLKSALILGESELQNLIK